MQTAKVVSPRTDGRSRIVSVGSLGQIRRQFKRHSPDPNEAVTFQLTKPTQVMFSIFHDPSPVLSICVMYLCSSQH